MITIGYKSKFSSILRACAAIGIGLVMIVSTNATEMVVKIIAAFLFAAGLVSFVYGYVHRSGGVFSLMSVNAVVDMCAGLLLFFFPSQVAGFIISLIGIALLIFGLLQVIVLVSTMSLVRSGLTTVILSSAAVLCGFVLLFNPFSQAIMSLVAGSALILYGLSELISTWRVDKAQKEYEIRFTKTDDGQKDDSSQAISTLGIADAREVEYEKIDEQ